MTKKGSIGAALRNRMQDAPTPELVKVVEPAPAAVALESFNTRLPKDLQKRLKIYAAANEVKVQDVVRQALEAFLED